MSIATDGVDFAVLGAGRRQMDSAMSWQRRLRVQAFVAEPAVNALDEPVLLRLSRRNVVLGNATLPLLAQHRVGSQLSTVVADDHRRTAAHHHDPVEFPPHAQPG